MTTVPPTAPPPTATPIGRFRRSARGLVVGHTGFTVAGYHSTFVTGLQVPLVAGTVFFGWRAVAVVAAVMASVYVGTVAWRGWAPGGTRCGRRSCSAWGCCWR